MAAVGDRRQSNGAANGGAPPLNGEMQPQHEPHVPTLTMYGG